MIIEDQVTAALTEAFAVAMGRRSLMTRRENVMGRFVHGFLPPDRRGNPEMGNRFHVTPSPHHPIWCQRRRGKPHMWEGSLAFSNAVNDAFAFLEAGHIPMPHHAWRLWKVADGLGLHA